LCAISGPALSGAECGRPADPAVSGSTCCLLQPRPLLHRRQTIINVAFTGVFLRASCSICSERSSVRVILIPAATVVWILSSVTGAAIWASRARVLGAFARLRAGLRQVLRGMLKGTGV